MKNKRVIRKLLGVGLAVGVLAGGGSAAFGVTIGEVLPPAPTREEAQDRSLEQYAALLDSFGNSQKMEYPDSYAGAYLNSQGQLVVKTTTTAEGARRPLRAAVQNTELIFESAEYSYNQLKAAQDAIFNYMEAHPEKGRLPIAMCALGEKENRVIVYVNGLSEETIAQVKAAVDSPALAFREAPKEEPAPQAEESAGFSLEQLNPRNLLPTSNPLVARVTPTILYSGSHILTEKLINGATYRVDMSVGYRAKNSQLGQPVEYGFLTAGHGTKDGGTVYSTAGTQIGTVTYRMFDSRGDFAFVKMTNTTTVNRAIVGETGAVDTNYGTPFVEGTILYKCGYQGGIAYGELKYASVDDFRPSGASASIRDLIQTSIQSGTVQGGDSGGIVYYRSIQGNNVPVGILSGLRSNYEGKFFMTVKAKTIAGWGVYLN